MQEQNKLLSMIGIARKAGHVLIGVPQICEHISKGKKIDHDSFLVIEAADTSDNTHKKVTNKCEFYNISHVRINATCTDLGYALGKSAVAAVAIIGKDMCCAIRSKL